MIKNIGPCCGHIYIVAATDKTEAIKLYEENFTNDKDDDITVREIFGIFTEGYPSIILSENIYSY